MLNDLQDEAEHLRVLLYNLIIARLCLHELPQHDYGSSCQLMVLGFAHVDDVHDELLRGEVLDSKFTSEHHPDTCHDSLCKRGVLVGL